MYYVTKLYGFVSGNILSRYLIAGGTAAFVDLAILFALRHIFGITHIVLWSVVAFLLAFFVSFYFQKLWTFQDNNSDKVHRQMFIYLLVQLFSLLLNTLAFDLLVHKFNIHYLTSQIIIGIFIAVSNFTLYRLLIFKKKITP